MDVLRALFDPALVTGLVAYLNHIRPDDAPALIDPSDPPEYAQFLHSTQVVRCVGAGQPPHEPKRVLGFSVGCSQRQVLDQVVQMVSNKPSHVLIAKRSTNGRGNIFTWNTIRTHLQNRSWKRLLSRIGDDAMRQLLSRCSVFEALENGCFLQVSGQAITRDKVPLCPVKHVSPYSATVQCSSMLYACRSSVSRAGLPSTHILNQVNDNVHALLADIFVSSNKRRARRSPSLRPTVQRLAFIFRRILKTHRHLNYHSILEQHCPVDRSASTLSDPSLSARYTAAIRQYTSADNVSAFVRNVVLRLIPRVLWGSKNNFMAFCQAVHTFVHLRRFESIDVTFIMQRLRTKDCSWLGDGVGARAAISKQTMLAKWLHWLVAELLVPLVRSAFYVTESEPYRNRIFFYRHEVWNRISDMAVTELCADQFRQIDEGSAQQMVVARGVGYSQLRILPKMNCVRPIVNCANRNAVGVGRQPSVNDSLKNAFSALSFERARNPGLCGISNAPNLDAVYDRLLPFVISLANVQSAGEKLVKVYMVSADIQKCYDSILRPRVMDILQNALAEKNYFVHRWATANRSAWGNGYTRKRYHRDAASVTSVPQMDELALERSKKCRNTVFVEQPGAERISCESLIQLIREHIHDNIVKFRKSFYCQAVGIPQGSIISSLLCSMYIADLERNQLEKSALPSNDSALSQRSWTIKASCSDSVVLRQVDDFLLLTTCKDVAESFLASMMGGFPEYNFSVNARKTQANFAVGMRDPDEPIKTVMTWCGLEFDSSRGLELRGDYSRFTSTSIADTLTVSRVSGRPCNKLRERGLRLFVESKTHPLLLDSRINTKRGICLNVYQLFRFGACKLNAWLSQLRHLRSTPFQCGLAEGLIHAFHVSRRRRCGDMEFVLSSNEVRWLALHALSHVFRRKQSRFRNLLAWIKAKLRSSDLRRLDHCSHLRFALRGTYDGALNKIKY
ncbi:Telomerase reverse transcriptase [Plasmodiophora brassicae]